MAEAEFRKGRSRVVAWDVQDEILPLIKVPSPFPIFMTPVSLNDRKPFQTSWRNCRAMAPLATPVCAWLANVLPLIDKVQLQDLFAFLLTTETIIANTTLDLKNSMVPAEFVKSTGDMQYWAGAFHAHGFFCDSRLTRLAVKLAAAKPVPDRSMTSLVVMTRNPGPQ